MQCCGIVQSGKDEEPAFLTSDRKEGIEPQTPHSSPPHKLTHNAGSNMSIETLQIEPLYQPACIPFSPFKTRYQERKERELLFFVQF